MKIALVFLVLIPSFFFNCRAQKYPRDIDMIFAKHHYSFTFIPFLDQKANITKNIDKYWIHSTIMHGFEAGFSRYSNFDRHYSIIVGLFFGAFARNFNYDIPGDEFNPPINGHINSNTALSREFNFMASVPIFFEKRWLNDNNNFWNGDIGITIRYTPSEDDGYSASVGYPNNMNVSFLDMELNTNYTKNPWLNYNLGGGYCWILRNNNIFKANLCINLSFTSFLRGNYKFTIPNKPVVEGDYKVKDSYIGLSFSYVFTRANKRFIKKDEKQF